MGEIMPNVIDSPPDESMFRKEESESAMVGNQLRSDTECPSKGEPESALVDNALQSDTKCHPGEESESSMANNALRIDTKCASVCEKLQMARDVVKRP